MPELSGPGANSPGQVIGCKALLCQDLAGNSASVAAAAKHKILLVFIQALQRCMQLAGSYFQVYGSRDRVQGKLRFCAYVQQLGLRRVLVAGFKGSSLQVFEAAGTGF